MSTFLTHNTVLDFKNTLYILAATTEHTDAAYHFDNYLTRHRIKGASFLRYLNPHLHSHLKSFLFTFFGRNETKEHMLKSN